MSEKLTVKVFLKTGGWFEFRCDKISMKTDRLTGAITNLDYDGAELPCPRYLDMMQVAAVLF